MAAYFTGQIKLECQGTKYLQNCSLLFLIKKLVRRSNLFVKHSMLNNISKHKYMVFEYLGARRR